MGNAGQNIPNRLGVLVRQYRSDAGWTQQELADRAGMSVASLRDLEQGRVARPRSNTLQRLADALNLAPDQSRNLTNQPHRQTPPKHDTHISVLGPLRLTISGTPVELASPIQRTLLGMLAVSVNAPVNRDTLIEAVWGTNPPPGAVELLQTHISRIRTRLKAAPDAPELVGTPAGYQLSMAIEQHDMLQFRQLILTARAKHETGETNESYRLFEQAMRLWRGEPLNDLASLAIHPMVTALGTQWRASAVEFANVAAELGRYEEVIPLLQQVTTSDPLHEAAHAALIIALAGSGQQAAGMQVFDGIRRRLASELGADPGPELKMTYQRVLRQEVTRPEAGPVSAHRQLPPDIADFSGRSAEMNTLLHSLPTSDDAGTSVVICALEGMGGVGKTRLAVHLAHQLLARGRYADHQLYVDLLGHADLPPADPGAVLTSFLRLLGVPGSQIPEDLAERAALYRDRLYDKKALVLLDNAASESQVMPLLPAGPANVVLVTSRRTLALDGAHSLPIEVFTPAEGKELLTQVVGAKRVEAEPESADRVVELCGRLPLGVALAARRLRSRTAWRFADLAERLEEAEDRLDELAAGGRRLQAVFELSYQALEPAEQRLFCRLGLHLSDDFNATSTAALSGLSSSATRRLLDRLVDERLVIAVSGDRYRFHDLLATYAQQLAATTLTEQEQREAKGALLDYYLHSTARAADLLQPHRWRADLAGTPPAYPVRLSTRNAAERWLNAERANLIAAVGFAADGGWPTHAWQLAHAMWVSLYLDGHVPDSKRTHELALAAAISAGDEIGEAVTRTYLGIALVDHGDENAFDQLNRALVLHRAAHNQVLEINTLCAMGNLSRRLGQFSDSLHYMEQALPLVSGGDAYREGVLRTNMASSLNMLGRFDEAIAMCERGLSLSKQAGDLHGESYGLAELGDSYRGSGQYDKAIDYFEQSLAVDGVHGPQEAYTRRRLGTTYRELGRFDAALKELNKAWQITRRANTLVTESETLVELGSAYREAGEIERAHDVLDRALTLAHATHQYFQQARGHEELARLFATTGDSELSQQHEHQAHTILVKLEMVEQSS